MVSKAFVRETCTLQHQTGDAALHASVSNRTLWRPIDAMAKEMYSRRTDKTTNARRGVPRDSHAPPSLFPSTLKCCNAQNKISGLYGAIFSSEDNLCLLIGMLIGILIGLIIGLLRRTRLRACQAYQACQACACTASGDIVLGASQQP